jgi:GT2 family glycosyltransferase
MRTRRQFSGEFKAKVVLEACPTVPPDAPWLRNARHDNECRAVTGACLLTRRDSFDLVNGFDENLAVVTKDTPSLPQALMSDILVIYEFFPLS